jgi:hypothetical protein
MVLVYIQLNTDGWWAGAVCGVYRYNNDFRTVVVVVGVVGRLVGPQPVTSYSWLISGLGWLIYTLINIGLQLTVDYQTLLKNTAVGIVFLRLLRFLQN